MSERRVLAAALLLVSSAVAPVYASEASNAAAASDAVVAAAAPLSRRIPARQAPHRARTTLDDRVATYAKELSLNAKQQSELRALLLQQRERMLEVWNNSSIPAAQRVHATKAIGEATADSIRAMLTEEQRKKYNPPRPPHDSTGQPGAPGAPGAADWINAAAAH